MGRSKKRKRQPKMGNAEQNLVASGGAGCLQILTIVFIVLKLTGTITWSWWLVLAPAWVPFAFAALALIAFGGIILAGQLNAPRGLYR